LEIIETRDSLDADDFHSQWHLKYNPETTVWFLFHYWLLINTRLPLTSISPCLHR
jgi:hypothetical protein